MIVIHANDVDGEKETGESPHMTPRRRRRRRQRKQCCVINLTWMTLETVSFQSCFLSTCDMTQLLTCQDSYPPISSLRHPLPPSHLRVAEAGPYPLALEGNRPYRVVSGDHRAGWAEGCARFMFNGPFPVYGVGVFTARGGQLFH